VTSAVTVKEEDADMPNFPSNPDQVDGYAECTVCRSDTRLLCSPCGDPVCSNCACPNGCDDAADAAPIYLAGHSQYADAAA